MKQLKIPSYSSLKDIVNTIPIDIDNNYYFLSKKEFISFLERFLRWNILSSDVEMIADLLESSDGIVYENEYVKEAIHLIANIDISWFTMHDLVEKILSEK